MGKDTTKAKRTSFLGRRAAPSPVGTPLTWENLVTEGTDAAAVEDFLFKADVGSVIFEKDPAIIKNALFSCIARFESSVKIACRALQMLQDCQLLCPGGISNAELGARLEDLLLWLAGQLEHEAVLLGAFELLAMVADRDVLRAHVATTTTTPTVGSSGGGCGGGGLLVQLVGQALQQHQTSTQVQRAGLQLYQALLQDATQDSRRGFAQTMFQGVLENIMLHNYDAGICHASLTILTTLADQPSVQTLLVPWAEQLINLALLVASRQQSAQIVARCFELLEKIVVDSDALLAVASSDCGGLQVFVQASGALSALEVGACITAFEFMLRILEDPSIMDIVFKTARAQHKPQQPQQTKEARRAAGDIRVDQDGEQAAAAAGRQSLSLQRSEFLRDLQAAYEQRCDRFLLLLSDAKESVDGSVFQYWLQLSEYIRHILQDLQQLAAEEELQEQQSSEAEKEETEGEIVTCQDQDQDQRERADIESSAAISISASAAAADIEVAAESDSAAVAVSATETVTAPATPREVEPVQPDVELPSEQELDALTVGAGTVERGNVDTLGSVDLQHQRSDYSFGFLPLKPSLGGADSTSDAAAAASAAATTVPGRGRIRGGGQGGQRGGGAMDGFGALAVDAFDASPSPTSGASAFTLSDLPPPPTIRSTTELSQDSADLPSALPLALTLDSPRTSTGSTASSQPQPQRQGSGDSQPPPPQQLSDRKGSPFVLPLKRSSPSMHGQNIAAAAHHSTPSPHKPGVTAQSSDLLSSQSAFTATTTHGRASDPSPGTSPAGMQLPPPSPLSRDASVRKTPQQRQQQRKQLQTPVSEKQQHQSNSWREGADNGASAAIFTSEDKEQVGGDGLDDDDYDNEEEDEEEEEEGEEEEDEEGEEEEEEGEEDREPPSLAERARTAAAAAIARAVLGGVGPGSDAAGAGLGLSSMRQQSKTAASPYVFKSPPAPAPAPACAAHSQQLSRGRLPGSPSGACAAHSQQLSRGRLPGSPSGADLSSRGRSGCDRNVDSGGGRGGSDVGGGGGGPEVASAEAALLNPQVRKIMEGAEVSQRQAEQAMQRAAAMNKRFLSAVERMQGLVRENGQLQSRLRAEAEQKQRLDASVQQLEQRIGNIGRHYFGSQGDQDQGQGQGQRVSQRGEAAATLSTPASIIPAPGTASGGASMHVLSALSSDSNFTTGGAALPYMASMSRDEGHGQGAGGGEVCGNFESIMEAILQEAPEAAGDAALLREMLLTAAAAPAEAEADTASSDKDQPRQPEQYHDPDHHGRGRSKISKRKNKGKAAKSHTAGGGGRAVVGPKVRAVVDGLLEGFAQSAFAAPVTPASTPDPCSPGSGSGSTPKRQQQRLEWYDRLHAPAGVRRVQRLADKLVWLFRRIKETAAEVPDLPSNNSSSSSSCAAPISPSPSPSSSVGTGAVVWEPPEGESSAASEGTISIRLLKSAIKRMGLLAPVGQQRRRHASHPKYSTQTSTQASLRSTDSNGGRLVGASKLTMVPSSPRGDPVSQRRASGPGAGAEAGTEEEGALPSRLQQLEVDILLSQLGVRQLSLFGFGFVMAVCADKAWRGSPYLHDIAALEALTDGLLLALDRQTARSSRRVTPLDAAPQLAAAEVDAVSRLLSRERRAFFSIFESYLPKTVLPQRGRSQGRQQQWAGTGAGGADVFVGMTFANVVQFSRDFQVMPAMLTRPQLLELFHSVLRSTRDDEVEVEVEEVDKKKDDEADYSELDDESFQEPGDTEEKQSTAATVEEKEKEEGEQGVGRNRKGDKMRSNALPTPTNSESGMISFHQFLDLIVLLALRCPVLGGSGSGGGTGNALARLSNLLLLLNRSPGRDRVAARCRTAKLVAFRVNPAALAALAAPPNARNVSPSNKSPALPAAGAKTRRPSSSTEWDLLQQQYIVECGIECPPLQGHGYLGDSRGGGGRASGVVLQLDSGVQVGVTAAGPPMPVPVPVPVPVSVQVPRRRPISELRDRLGGRIGGHL